MIVSLDRLTDPEIKRSLDRAQAITPAVSITERGDGFVRGSVACNGTCGARAFHGDQHDVVLWWNRIATCSCPAVHGCCYHIAALWAHEGGAIPDKPKTCEARGCGSSPAMFLMGGDGHHHTCPLYGSGQPYQAPTKEPTPIRKRKPSHVKSRLELQQETRPQVRLTPDGFLEARRMPCEHVVAVIAIDDEWTALPLSWDEGCSACPAASNHAPVAVDMLPEAVGR